MNAIKNIKMENPKIFSQYAWVLDVLTSCENEEQIGTSEKLFELFLINWGKSIPSSTKTILVREFENDKKLHLTRVSKKGKYYTKTKK